jgi:hypothetical protein
MGSHVCVCRDDEGVQGELLALPASSWRTALGLVAVYLEQELPGSRYPFVMRSYRSDSQQYSAAEVGELRRELLALNDYLSTWTFPAVQDSVDESDQPRFIEFGPQFEALPLYEALSWRIGIGRSARLFLEAVESGTLHICNSLRSTEQGFICDEALVCVPANDILRFDVSLKACRHSAEPLALQCIRPLVSACSVALAERVGLLFIR